ncbi:MAG: GatB/YqeY domain-containing protein [Proteobacteria bacterium]|nr:GatB/YqeY domain-containing protein [Pseudomonadota bacterium]
MAENKTVEYGWHQGMEASLHDKVKADLKTAMLNRDNDVRNAIRVVMGEYPKLTVPITLESGKKTFRVKKPEEISDDDLLGVIRGLVKSEKSVLELQNKKSSSYLELLELYLPKMITREEVKDWIKENIDFSQFNSPMQAMGTIMKHYGKLADGNMVKGLLQEMSSS